MWFFLVSLQGAQWWAGDWQTPRPPAGTNQASHQEDIRREGVLSNLCMVCLVWAFFLTMLSTLAFYLNNTINTPPHTHTHVHTSHARTPTHPPTHMYTHTTYTHIQTPVDFFGRPLTPSSRVKGTLLYSHHMITWSLQHMYMSLCRYRWVEGIRGRG